MTTTEHAQAVKWEPTKPRLRPLRLLVSWAIAAATLYVAAILVPGVTLEEPGAAFVVAAVVAVLNAVLPPLVAALRLPFMLVLGFVLVLVVDALVLLLADELLPDFIKVDSFGDALLASLVMAAVSILLQVITGTNDDDEYTLRVVKRIARQQGVEADTDTPGILFLEIDGLALPVLRQAMRDGSAPNMARWVSEDGYRLAEWEPDLSSQTGASQAGILLGSNENIPAFRWVEKETARVIACSAPADCAEIESRHATGVGLLVNGGASRGNLLSGEADEVILTVSRFAEEKRANPGYRAFYANGFNVTRALVLFFWEVLLEWSAAIRAARRDVRPRGHRGGIYPLMRAAMCVVVRDLVVFGVLTDMMRGRPAIYATFASYDEVAHHSGVQRADTMEALRKLDQQFGRLERARRYAARPYEIVVLSDHGQTQGATFKQRNGYGLDDLVERSLSRGEVEEHMGGDEQDAMVGLAVKEATGREQDEPAKEDVSGRDAVVLGSGNLGLIYLMEEKRRLTLEEIEERHPALIPALRSHPHVGWLLVRSGACGAVAIGAEGSNYLAEGRIEGKDPLAPFSPNAPHHLLRTDGFTHVADIMVGSFYDHDLDEGCAFEELISFHGGLGGLQTRPFILYPERFLLPDKPIVGAAAVHGVLTGWRQMLQGAQPQAEADSASEAHTTPTRMPAPLPDSPGGATLDGPQHEWKGGIPLDVEDLAGHDLEDMGPVDYVLIEFPDGQPKGQAAPLLLDLVDRGLIRILDLMFISKDQDGTTTALEIADIDGDGAPDFMVFEGAKTGLLSDEDRDEAGNAMEPDTAALLIVFENRWAAPFAKAMREAGGQLVAFGRIPVQALLASLDHAEARS